MSKKVSEGQSALERIRARQTPWQRLRNKLWVKWAFFKLDLGGCAYFNSLNSAGESFMRSTRPWLARRLFPHAHVIHYLDLLPDATDGRRSS
jgi:hypothetical protein